jgi:hypothetical protein
VVEAPEEEEDEAGLFAMGEKSSGRIGSSV